MIGGASVNFRPFKAQGENSAHKVRKTPSLADMFASVMWKEEMHKVGPPDRAGATYFDLRHRGVRLKLIRVLLNGSDSFCC